MARDQRVSDNHALLYAQECALEKELPLAVLFCLKKTSSSRAKEHYEWMIEGLKQIENKLQKLNVPFILLIGDPKDRLSGAFKHLLPSDVVFDFSPLRGAMQLQEHFLKDAKFQISVVDTHNVVPVWQASDKQEFGARTIRPKIHKQLQNFLVEPPKMKKHPFSWAGTVMDIDSLSQKINDSLSLISSNSQENIQNTFPPGENSAQKALKEFLINSFINYAELRNDPSAGNLSNMSPYLHFGQISSLRVALEASIYADEHPETKNSLEVLIEEMIVRKELSDNYCYYNQNYDNFSGLAEWAKITLNKHKNDEREFTYSLKELTRSLTHDPAWNACQSQLVQTGKMHGYMRMYWAKKVLEWSESPEIAIKNLVYLNDFYSIDGGDPNGYVGILWSVGGLHDRPWGERPVYGTIRSMVYSGLKRKFDIESYEKTWNKN